jgi:hypothetical protein
MEADKRATTVIVAGRLSRRHVDEEVEEVVDAYNATGKRYAFC